jgi:hypothetical protein
MLCDQHCCRSQGNLQHDPERIWPATMFVDDLVDLSISAIRRMV